MTLAPEVPHAPNTAGHRLAVLPSSPRLDFNAFWTKDAYFSRSQVTSVLIHGALALLLILPFYLGIVPLPNSHIAPNTSIFYGDNLSDYVNQLKPVPDPGHGGGGGGDHEQTPATKGMLPPFIMKPPIVPPGLVRNPNAELQVTPTLLGSPQLNTPAPSLANWGLPAVADSTTSQGPGGNSGIGNGKEGGIGDDRGSGYGPGRDGGTGGNIFTPGAHGIGYPVCITCPRPDYSEDARKAKVQGSVLLNVVVLADGKVGSIELVKSLGMGLDQQAINSVRAWKFRPGTDAAGRAVATRVPIEVQFQLF
jgi:periplasmic protein TonB